MFETLSLSAIAFAQGENNFTLIDGFSVILSNNKILISTLIQFLMGVGLGYYFAKAIKYLVALVLVIIVGSLLNIWSFGGSIDNIISSYISSLAEYRDEVLVLMKIFGAMLIGPILIGFVIGIIVGLTRK